MRTGLFWGVAFVGLGACSSTSQPAEGGVDASSDSPIADTGTGADVVPDAPPACPCTSTQFCKGTTCVEAIFANICTDTSTTVVLDGQMTDDAAGHVIGDAIKASCMTTLRYTSGQSIPGVLEPTTSRPITGPGDMMVLTGGPFFQAPAKFMDIALSPLFTRSTQNGTHIEVVERKSQNVVLDAPIGTLTATHDYFILQLAFEPKSGTLVLMAYGLYGIGTTAVGWWFQNLLLPKKDQFQDRYYAIEWTETDQTPGPSMQDTYFQVWSGN